MQVELAPRRHKVIGLTPLIDVVFILLLFFMLSTQFSRHKAMTLNVPTDSAIAKKALNTNEQLLLMLLADGSVRIDGSSPVSLDRIGTQGNLQSALSNGLPVYIDAEDQVALQALITLTDTLNSIGFSKVTMNALR